ncbi:MAG TPA: glycosyltransferase family 4 protein [Stellaceae bacterium]|nr:glycosyltransferase family 4 protein [Stellaceae bacterium]
MRDGASARDLLFFTPLPPKRNGIADYSYQVLAGLALEYNCIAVVANDHGEASAPPGVDVISTVEYVMQSERLAPRLHVYQLGNNPDHAFMLPFMAERPGVAVLHDPSLHDLLDLVSVRIDDVSRYADALEAEHGLAGRILGEQFRRYRLRERRMFFDMPMLRGIAGPSLGVIVHSRYAAVKVLARAPQAPVTIVPHQYVPPSDEGAADPVATRRALGVADDEILFLSLGFVTRAKRIDAALRALAIARDRLPPFKYVIAGEIKDTEPDVPALAASLGLGAVVSTLGYVEESRFAPLVRAADIVINLRYPVAGETSGTMIRALGAGGCLVVVDRGAFAELPDDAAVRVAWGGDFEHRLAAALERLARDKVLRRRIGGNARDFIAANNRLDLTIAGYRRAFERAWSMAPPAWEMAADFEFLPPHRLSEAIRAARTAQGARPLPLWFEAGAVPVCDGKQPRTLVIGGDHAGLLDRLGYRRDGEHALQLAAIGTTDIAAHEMRATDLAIVLPDAVLADDDSGAALAAINRRLAFGGILVWHRARRHNGRTGPPLARQDAMRLFAAYGFRVDASFTGSPPQLDERDASVAADEVQDECCWRLYKVSETFAGADFRVPSHG